MPEMEFVQWKKQPLEQQMIVQRLVETKTKVFNKVIISIRDDLTKAEELTRDI